MISGKIKKLNEAKEENERNVENLQSNQNGTTDGAQQVTINENPITSQEKGNFFLFSKKTKNYLKETEKRETAENAENKEKGNLC